jgi:hypothetical protein
VTQSGGKTSEVKLAVKRLPRSRLVVTEETGAEIVFDRMPEDPEGPNKRCSLRRRSARS